VGTVFLVGAGPGDPGLLTVRGSELLGRADVVIHDRGVSRRLMERVPIDAERLSVGVDLTSQEDVNRALVEAARTHDVVVRLKVGDPFVFGRGGEEALAVRAAGLPFEVVPGITAGIAAPTYAGIPVTHAATSSVLTLVDALDEGEWPPPGRATLVAFMATRRLASFAERLTRRGWPPETSAAIVERGTTSSQRTITAPLSELASRAAEAAVSDPAVVVVGEVVGLRQQLRWFEDRPLFGLRVLVTRPRAQADDLVQALELLGAEAVPFPTIRIVAPDDEAPLLNAARDVAFYDWIVFTSVNGVERFWGALESAGHDARALGGVQVACIGLATAAACELRGVRPDVVPAQYVAEEVVAALAAAAELAGARILLPRAAEARDALPSGLEALGARAEIVEAYRTVPDTSGGSEMRRRIQAREIDVLSFTSSSTVRHFVEAAGTDTAQAVVAAIGPITAATARELGLRVDVEAVEHTVPGLVQALVRHFRGPRASDAPGA
jgi:uroporphyrinogen III methyltransferase / synthase